YTIFCPPNSVMEEVDSRRKLQISDPRNYEVTEKLASYHIIPNGKVTQERLKREDWTSGGFMGFGAKEDGGVVIGNNEAKVVRSVNVGKNGIVHEVDAMVAP
ncbi:hypothetical protein THAPSDRAFT_260762, partial [Thalassiosira pseudonana CCMP1335]